MGEVAAHARPINEGAGRRRLGVRDPVFIVDVLGDPVQNGQNPRPARRLAELARHEPAELVRRAIAAGLKIGQDLGRQIAPVVLRDAGRQPFQHPIVDHRLIDQADLALDVAAQGPGAEIDVLVFLELDRRIEGQSLLQNLLAGPVGDLNLVDGVRGRIKAVNELGANAQFHGV